MDYIVLAALLLVIILLIIVLVRGVPSGGQSDVIGPMAEQEKRLREEMDRLRQQVETLLRDSAVSAASLQGTAKQEILTLLGTRTQETQQVIGATLAEGRRSQDERLDRLDASLGSFRETLTRESTAQKEMLKDLQGQLVQGQNDFTQKLSAATNNAINELREKLTAQLQQRLDRVDELLAQFQRRLSEGMGEQQTRLAEMKATFEGTQKQALGEMKQSILEMRHETNKANAEFFAKTQQVLDARLEQLRVSSEQKLELIRGTVDEKLQTTLEQRLGESFRTVCAQLESVQKGLGEMQILANGVGDLKRVLTNVKTRGTFGEMQLAALLEQVLTPSQYETNVATIPGSDARVEFAICLPGRDEDNCAVYLPIDAKFPMDAYEAFQSAVEAGEKGLIDETRKVLGRRILGEAKSIREKYVSPPHTTDFAMLYLPTEGLYAEAVRMDGLLDTLQRQHRVILVGPTTLFAILNSLQMGFRTLAIQKRSSEVWKILSAVKTEFGKFGESVKAVSKKLQEASNKMNDVEGRTRQMSRALKSVEEMESEKALELLPLQLVGEAAEE